MVIAMKHQNTLAENEHLFYNLSEEWRMMRGVTEV